MLIDVDRFGMTIGGKRVVDDLSFTVDAGEALALLGSNGSGKTTTLRCLLGTMTPTVGSLRINGSQFSPRGATRVGYLPEERGLYRKERVLDVMTYLGEVKGLGRPAARRAALEYLERVGLGDKQHTRLDRLSGGQHQKVQLGIAIMNDPQVLVLDEPGKGLDPINRRLLMDLIQENRERGAGVILVTHDMEEVEQSCQSAVLLRDGKTKARGSISEIRAAFSPRIITVRCSGRLTESAKYSIESVQGDLYRVTPVEGIADDEVLREMVLGGSRVEFFEPETASMTDVYVRLYEGEES